MDDTSATTNARERIIDAAWDVMKTDGLVNATTKTIAGRAERSEALIYRYFADKQELFLAVLLERLHPLPQESMVAGRGELAENLVSVSLNLQRYYAELLPITASLFGSPELLRQHRDGVQRRGGLGPSAPVAAVIEYLEEERSIGRVTNTADLPAIAALLVGAALQHGFLVAYGDAGDVVGIRASALVAAVVPALTTRGTPITSD